MSIDSDYTWVKLSDELPPTLNSRAPASDLTEGETPLAYGIDANRSGKLMEGSCPTGTAAIVKTYTVSSAYEWHFNRLWRISSTQLIYGAPEYTTAYYPQGLGHLDFNEDSNSLIKMLPVGDSMMVFKSTGAYIIPNATDHDARFFHSDIIQDAYISTATHAVSLGGLAFVSNANGLFAISPSGEVTEITLPVRGGSVFVSTPLTADYSLKFIIGNASKYCYDMVAKKLFDYNTSGFLYTTKTLKMNRRESYGNPFTISRVAFEIEHTTADTDGQLTFQTQMDDRGWNAPQIIDCYYDRDGTERVQVDLDAQENCRAFRLKLTDLTGLAIRKIYANSSDFTQNSFAD